MAAYAPLGGLPQAQAELQNANTNSLAEYTRAAQQRSQAALTQQQTQGVSLENQQRQLDLKNQQVISQLAPQHVTKDDSGKVTGYDWNGLAQDAISKGVSPQYVNGLQMNIAKTRTELAGANKAELDNQNAISSQALGMHEDLKGLTDPTDRQQAYQKMVGFMQSHGLNTSAYPAQVPQSNDDLTHLEIPLGMHAQLVKESGEQATAAQEQAKARAENATAAHQEFVNGLTKNSKFGDFDSQVDAILPPKGTQTGGQNVYTKAMVNGALSRGDLPGAQKIMDDAFQSVNGVQKDIAVNTNPAIQKGKIDLATAEGKARMEAQLALLSPEARAMAAQYYSQTGAMPAGMRSPGMSAGILNTAAGPEGTPTPNVAANKMAYGTATAEQKAYTSGSQGQQLTAIGTARNHMQTFKDTADALQNGDFLKANQVGNYLGMQFGSDKATNFNIAKSAFAGEVGKAFAGANVGVQDRQELMDKISAASSPAQLKGYAQKADELLAGKQQSLKQSYEAGMKGQPNFGNSAPVTKTYQGHTYTQQPDGTYKLTQ